MLKQIQKQRKMSEVLRETTAGSKPLVVPERATQLSWAKRGGYVPAQQFPVSRILIDAEARKRRKAYLLVLFCTLPAIAFALVGILFFTPMYETEARFVLRGGQSAISGTPNSGLSSVVNTASNFAGLVDGYAVRDHLASKATYEYLENIGYASRMRVFGATPDAMVQTPEVQDAAFASFRKNVLPRFNLTEQIVVLRVFAFSPDDAKTIASKLLTAAELFADDMNRRAREDWLKLVENELMAAENALAAARVAVARWRAQNAQFDPSADIANINALLQQLETKLVTVKLDREQVYSLGINHPMRKSADNMVKMVEHQIQDARARLGGADLGKVPALIAEYEKLKIEQEVAEKRLEVARKSKEQAQLEIGKQQKYVVMVSPPFEPYRTTWPNIWIFALMGAGAGLLLLAAGAVLNELRIEHTFLKSR